MNVYISDSIARAHADRMMADAAAARRARHVRAARRAASRTSPQESAADRSPGVRSRGPLAAAHIAARPFTAFHSWLLAGQL
ncbi:MAG: hypothetical protein QOI15_1794 [Pseudonocardiales bacterium]|jgi:hypothetical protein|nr:hypothetical protein [Pseudonocardiales bacterium]